MADDARNVAVLIDFENLNDSTSLRKVLEHGAKRGNVVAKLAIGDFGANGDKAHAKLRELGILPVQQSAAVKGKNSSDIRLTIEAMSLFYNREKSVDVFVIATSDTDFLPLAQWLRAAGKHVVGAGRSDASPLWQKGVDEFVVVKEVKVTDEVVKAPEKSKSSPSSKANKPAVKAKTAKTNVINPAYKEVIETAIKDVFSNGASEVRSRALLKRVMQLDQGFSCRKAGFNSFRKLIASFGMVRIPANPPTGEFVIRKRGSW